MRGFALAAVLFGSACPALAQGSDSPWLVEYDGEATLVVAPSGSSDIAPERENALYEVGLGLTAERTFQSGWTLGGRAVFRAARDHPARPAGTGNLFATDLQGPGGAFSRLSAGPLNIDEGPRGSLETAYLFLDTGYGEFSLGRDTGVAARFHEGNVSALSRSTLVDPDLDVSGIAAINTRPDITGPSVKLSYVTPRLLGVRAGVSYTPRSEVRGLDRDATESNDPFRPELENTVEVALNASRRLRESGVRLRSGLSYSTAELDVPTTLEATYDDRIDVVSIGGEIEWQDTYRLGLNWLGADEG
ncbi:MAG: porin, partial [Pseudomonadota bacterium]